MSNPPAGWYNNPEGVGQRYWDGLRWTDQFQPGMVERPARPNEHAVGLAVLFGVISYIGLLVVLNPRIGGTSAYGGGRLIVPAAVAAAVVGLVARGTTRPFGWWVYALAVPIAAAVLAVAMVGGDLRESSDEAATRGEPVGVLSAPGTGDGWTVVDTVETRAEVERVTQGMATQFEGDIDSVVAEFYTHTSAPASTVFLVGLNGELDPDSSAGETLEDVLAGAYVDDPKDFDPGDVGGALGCGEAAAQGLEWVSCAWIGNERAVLLRWNDKSVGLDQAAELTRDLRERASH